MNSLIKCSSSVVKAATARVTLGYGLFLALGGDPVYLGRGSLLVVGEDVGLRLSQGMFTSEYSSSG